MFDFWFFRPNVRGTLLLNTWLTLIDWWTSLCKCCLASKISTPRSCPSWRITWSLWDHETTLRPLSFAWTKITKKKWSTTTPQTWRPRFKVTTFLATFIHLPKPAQRESKLSFPLRVTFEFWRQCFCHFGQIELPSLSFVKQCESSKLPPLFPSHFWWFYALLHEVPLGLH